MQKEIIKLYDEVRQNREGQDVVTAIFRWDGQNRSVPVLVGKHKVGDLIEVHLREVYSKEKKQAYKWWECVEE